MMTVLGQTVYDVSHDQKVHSVYPQSNAFSICMEMMYIYIQYKGGARLIVQKYKTPTNAQICMRRETVEVQCKFNKEICAMRKASICKQTTMIVGKETMLKTNMSQTVTENVI